VPYIPVEIVLLPRWFPFHLNKVSYWSRNGDGARFSFYARASPSPQNPRKVADSRVVYDARPEQERHYFRRPGGGRADILSRVFSGARPAGPQ